jgi:ankyrin repeat protein
LLDVEQLDPVALAASQGHAEIVRLLLAEFGADKQAVDDRKRTPLHHAAVQGHLDVVKLLVGESGADMQAKDDNRWTSLHFAMSQGHAEVVRFLLAEIEGYTNRYELFVDVADDYGPYITQRIWAILILSGYWWKNSECRQMQGTKNNSTPLHKAVLNGRSEWPCRGCYFYE